MDNEKAELPSKLVRRVYTDLHKANQNSIELTAIVREESLKIKDLLDKAPPWSYYYDLPYLTVLALLFKTTGFLDQILELCRKENSETLLLDFLESEPDIEHEESLTLEERAIISSLAIAVFFQVPAISMFNKTIHQLVEKAKNGNDKALFNAIMVDRTVLSTPSVTKRIQIAQLKNDLPFFKKLSKALNRKMPRRPLKKHDDLRFMISALQDSTMLSNLSNSDFYSLLVDDLELYSTDGKDPFKSFEQLLTRSRKNITYTK